MKQENLKKKIEEIEEQIELPLQKKRYKSYKKGFARKYTRYK